MTTTLTFSGTTHALPDDLLWSDEYGWRQVDQRTQYTITGALIVEASARQAGRPITLRGGPDYGWVARSTLEALRAWAAVPARQFSLVLRGEPARTVVFDHASGAIEAAPVWDTSDVAAGDPYIVTLRFLEV